MATCLGSGRTHHSRDADPARLDQCLKAGCYINSVAVDVIGLSNHVPEINTDPKLDPLLRRDRSIALGHAALHLHGALDRIHDARELGQEAIAGVLDDPATVLGDLWLDQLGKVPFEPFVCPLLIGPH